MTIAVPFFGQDPLWRQLLEVWWEAYHASGTNIPAVVITDEDTCLGFPHLRVDTWEQRHAMRGHPWDRKGAIVVSALQVLGPVLVCDVDAFIQRDPAAELATLHDVPMATRPDGWRRRFRFIGSDIEQRQAGVMWFGAGVDRAKLGETYRDAFAVAAVDFGVDEWLEQIAWTFVAATYGMHDLPETLNCSHCVPGATCACIVHEHGTTKWKRLQSSSA